MRTRLSFILVTTTAALLFLGIQTFSQPTGLRDFGRQQRIQLTQRRLESVRSITRVIDQQPNNPDNYRERMRLYRDLLELNYDNRDWDTFADGFAADISKIAEIEKTPGSLMDVSQFMRERLLHSPPTTFSSFYRKNRFFDLGVFDLMKALKRATDNTTKQTAYILLGDFYTLRAQLAVSAQFFEAEALKSIRNDLAIASENVDLAWGLAWDRIRYPDFIQTIVELCVRGASVNFRLKDYEAEIKLYQVTQARLDTVHPPVDFWKCEFYAGWAQALLMLNRSEDARSKLASIPKSSRCSQLDAIKKMQ